MAKFLDDAGLNTLIQNIKAKFVAKESGKSLVSDTLITKLTNMNENANQTKIKVGDNTMGTAKGDDTFTIVGSGDTSVTANTSTKTITISSTNPAVPEYTIAKQATAETGYFATYQLKKDNVAIGDKINIPKDYLVKSGSVKTCTTANVPVTGYKVGDKYIDFVINTKDTSDTDEHLYILVSDLVDTYTAGSGIDITNNVIEAKLGSGLGFKNNNIYIPLGSGCGLDYDDSDNRLYILAGSGIVIGNGVSVRKGNGLKFDSNNSNALTVDAGNGINFDTNGRLIVSASQASFNFDTNGMLELVVGSGIMVGSQTGVTIKLDENNKNGLSTSGNGLALGQASTSAFGAVKVTSGNGLGISNGIISMAVGTNSTPGAVKVTNGNGLAINNSTGEISMSAASGSAAGAMSSADYSKLSLLQALPTAVGTYTYNVTTAGTAGAYTAMQFVTYSGAGNDIDAMWAGTYTPS